MMLTDQETSRELDALNSTRDTLCKDLKKEEDTRYKEGYLDAIFDFYNTAKRKLTVVP
jgi:hypothetical protein